MRKIVTLALFFFASHVYGSTCSGLADGIGLEYNKTKERTYWTVDGEKIHDAKSESIMLWRNGNQVAIENKNKRITELWEKTRNQRIKMTRYFDEHRRGIEYQPDEIEYHDVASQWDYRWQLITLPEIQSMKLVKTQGQGCGKKEFYQDKSKGVSRELVWLPNQKVMQEYRLSAKNKSVRYRLRETENARQVVKSIFLALADYDTTDYTDIGDNESDPFLLNMINLGFVEHGSSGFYDAKGNNVDGRDSHGHEGHGHHH